MNKIKYLQQRIEEELKKHSAFGRKSPAELYEPIEYTLLNGGKRLRPTLVLLATDLFYENIEQALLPSVGIEIFHNFTLIHDDIMDNSSLRRGKPTVFKKWNTNIALLSGDAMLIKAYQFISKCNKNALPEVLRTFNNIALKVCEGQQYDMNFEKQENVSIADYIKMIELKTAELIGGSLKIGAIIGNAKDADLQNIYYFGKNIGIAFQLQDDFLDVFADTKKFGKKLGNDIVSNKKTFLLLKALELAQNRKKILKDLNKWIDTKKFNPTEKIKAITEIFIKLNIKEITQEQINEYYKKGLRFFEKIKVKEEKKIHLKNFVESLINRDF